jgi:uncharacterized protein
MEKFEVRHITEVRADQESRMIQGQAIVFESESEDLGFTEVLHRGSITQELIDSCDVVMLYNHSEANGILARRNQGKGTLDISVDDNGVNFSFRAKKTNLGEEVLQSVMAGDLSGCSFAFRLDENDTTAQKWSKRSDGKYFREIFKVAEVRDLSIVTVPAYAETSVSTRGPEELKKSEELLEIDTEAEAQQRKAEDEKFSRYYEKLKKQYLYK